MFETPHHQNKIIVFYNAVSGHNLYYTIESFFKVCMGLLIDYCWSTIISTLFDIYRHPVYLESGENHRHSAGKITICTITRSESKQF